MFLSVVLQVAPLAKGLQVSLLVTGRIVVQVRGSQKHLGGAHAWVVEGRGLCSVFSQLMPPSTTRSIFSAI